MNRGPVLSWWCHQMEPFPRYWPFVRTGEFPSKWPVTRSLDVFFEMRLNKRVDNQSRGWWFLRRHRAHYDVTVMSVPDTRGMLGLYVICKTPSSREWKGSKRWMRFLDIITGFTEYTSVNFNQSGLYWLRLYLSKTSIHMCMRAPETVCAAHELCVCFLNTCKFHAYLTVCTWDSVCCSWTVRMFFEYL